MCLDNDYNYIRSNVISPNQYKLHPIGYNMIKQIETKYFKLWQVTKKAE